jgi:serine/threonine protein phosphatase 1
MKEEVFVVGDVHGEITLLKKLLEKWDREKQQLIFIGDLGDRGENSKACFLLAKELVEKQGAIYLIFFIFHKLIIQRIHT